MDHSRARQQIHKECTHRIFTYHNYRIDLGEGDQLFCGGLVLSAPESGGKKWCLRKEHAFLFSIIGSRQRVILVQ